MQNLKLIAPIIVMSLVISISNIVVQYPVNWFGLDNILTYSALTYPFVFLTNDITNRLYGPIDAAKVVLFGFMVGFIVTCLLAPVRLAIGSSAAFLFGQLLDIVVFTPLRRKTWWIAPLVASIFGTILDNVIFFSLAFAPSFGFIDRIFGQADSSIVGYVQYANTSMPIWLSLAIGSLGVKLLLSSFMVLPYGAIMRAFFANLFYNKAKA